MKKLLMFLIPALLIVLVILLVIKNTAKGLVGTIKSIDNDSRTIVIYDGLQDMKLNITNTTKLLDVRNQPTIFSEFNVGFEVEVWFKKNNEELVVEKIRITKAPNILILSPSNNDVVKREFKVSGSARVFENVLQVEVTNADNNQSLYKKTVMASPIDIGLFGPFETEINISNYPEVKNIRLDAFQYSAKDGSVTDKTSINLEVN